MHSVDTIVLTIIIFILLTSHPTSSFSKHTDMYFVESESANKMLDFTHKNIQERKSTGVKESS